MKLDCDFADGNQVYDSLYEFTGNKELAIQINGSQVLKLKNVIAFPGVTNSHDHLEFNSFPFLGNGIYKDSGHWGEDIHKKNTTEINAVLSIPVSLRIKWGIFKNLINGATCIAHHGRYQDVINTFRYPVYLNYQYIDALNTELYWKIKLNSSFNKDVMIHVGEGVETQSHAEVSKLIRWNFFNRKLIGIHAIAMDIDQSKEFKAIVWCPDSNLKLYGKTACVDQLKNQTSILFGTDSTASASANMWEQLRVARKLALLSDEELYNTLIINPSIIFPSAIPHSQIIAKRKSGGAWDSFFELEPEDLLLVTIENKIMLADRSCLDLDSNQYTTVWIGDSEKWVVKELASAVYELEGLGISLPLKVRSKQQV